MQIGVSSYCYSQLINKGGFSLFDAIDHAAKTGYSHMEFSGFGSDDDENNHDLAKKLRDYTGEKGLKIAAFLISADFLNNKDEVARAKKCIDITNTLGAKMMRHDTTWKGAGQNFSYKNAIDAIAPAIREVTEYAASLGIKTMTENHGYFIQDSYRMEYLINTVNHPNYGVLADIGNFLCADESPIIAVDRVAPYVMHVHAKDFLFKKGTEPSPGESWFKSRGGNHLRGTIVGHGIVPVAQCLNILKNSGYTGDISLEFEGPEDVLFAIESGYHFLHNIISA